MATGPETQSIAAKAESADKHHNRQNDLLEQARSNRRSGAEARHQPSPEDRARRTHYEVNAGARKMSGEAKFKAFNESVDKSRQNWERATQIRDTMKDFKAGRDRFQAEKAQGNKSNINPEVAARINAARPAMEKALAQERANQPLPQRESQLNQQATQSEQDQQVQQTETIGTGQTNLSELPAPRKYAAERRSARLQGERNQLEKEKAEAKRQAEKEKREIQQQFEKLIKEVQDKAKAEQTKLDDRSQSVKQMLEGGVNVLARVGLKHELGKLDKASEKLGRQTKESIKGLEKRRDGLLKEVQKSLEKRTNSLNKLLKETNRSIGRAEFAANLNRKAGKVREFLHNTREAASKGIRAGAWELAGRAANAVGNRMNARAENIRAGGTNNSAEQSNVISIEDYRRRQQVPEQQRPGAVAA